MNPRITATLSISAKNRPPNQEADTNHSKVPMRSSEQFAQHVFNKDVVKLLLPSHIALHLIDAMDGKTQIQPEYADSIAIAMREWAMGLGAAHYTHWFVPLTGTTAGKNNLFIDWCSPEKIVERFSGSDLIQGESDASSFPSGGLRSTFEARGYTGWDPTSPAFLWQGGAGLTLCVPSIFLSWNEDALDGKIPLLRSESIIRQAALRLLRLTGVQGTTVYSNLGFEQEYFLVDHDFRNLRPDLQTIGRTVFGAAPPKKQELQDHYFGTIKDRVMYFMGDFEAEALKLGIPVKTHHNEVAPGQYEVAPVYERASLAVDHNILLMLLMRHIALKHGLVCLFHEKPFYGFNGSGKHSNWSLSTDTGFNLLDPSKSGNAETFLILCTAVIHAVHRHGGLLRAAIGSASNDYRLGGHEAPPAIISVYVGEGLEQILSHIEDKGFIAEGFHSNKKKFVLPDLSHLPKDNSDRNRTSPFAFTGNKFEFRAVGSSANPAFVTTVLHAIVAESLNEMVDAIEKKMKKEKTANLLEAATPVIREYLKKSRPVRFGGDNYSQKWTEEAKKRGLPNFPSSIDVFEELKSKEAAHVFKGILTPQELVSRYDIMVECYVNTLQIEVKLMLELLPTKILPAAFEQQQKISKSILQTIQVLGKSAKLEHQKQELKHLSELIEEVLMLGDKLDKARLEADKFDQGKRALYYAKKMLPICASLRKAVDALEGRVDDQLWLLPKYRELLYLS